MEYNTAKDKLINGEYGRHIQRMIEYTMGIKDRNLRNQQAQAIVRTMSCFSQGSKDTEDYWYKLWDQLFVISGFRLDIDSPFPKPTPEIETRPKPLAYPKHNIRLRTYGVLIEKIIKKLTTEKDSEEKAEIIANIANHLKKLYLNWNRDSVNDALIIEHLELLSGGKLNLKEDFKFPPTRDILNDLASSNNNNGVSLPKNKKKKKKKVATTTTASNNNKGNAMANNRGNAMANNNRNNKNTTNNASHNNNKKNKPQVKQQKS
jgi:hypothetical protein